MQTPNVLADVLIALFSLPCSLSTLVSDLLSAARTSDAGNTIKADIEDNTMQLTCGGATFRKRLSHTEETYA